jgi:hypothetical protein
MAACQQPAAPPAASGTTPGAKAPAVLKGTSLSILQGTYFVAAGQDLFKSQAEQWGKDNGVTMNVDFLNWYRHSRVVAQLELPLQRCFG